MIGTIPLAASFLNPAAVPKRRRSLYANIFDRLGQGGDQNLTDDQKEGLTRQGLLNLGIGMLQTKGQGFGGALGAGLQSGLLSVNQGVEDIGNQRYKDEILARTRQGMERNTAIEQAQQGVFNPDGTLNQEKWGQWAAVDPVGASEFRQSITPKPQNDWTLGQIGDGEGGTLDVWVNKDTRELRDLTGNPIGGEGFLSGATLDAPAAGGFNEVIGGLLGREGGYVADDAGAGPSNFGINSRANPDVDVANLTPQQAMELYKVRYWDPIGGDSLPPQIREAAFDAAVNQGPERAKQWLASANNDPREFARLRQQHYDSLVQRDPAKYGQYAEGWRKRNMETAGLGGGVVTSPMQSRLGRRPGKTAQAEPRYRTLSAEQVRSLGLPEGTVAQESPSGQVQIVNKPRDLPTGGQVVDNGDGTTTFIPAGKLTEGERNAAGFYQRMTAANEEMKRLTDAGYSPSVRDMVSTGSTWTNFAATPEGQQYYQAAMNWVRANLRKESGAAIGVDEARQEIRNYFPMPGDSKEVIAQKERNRQTTERAMRQAAGGALPPAGGGGPKRPPASDINALLEKYK